MMAHSGEEQLKEAGFDSETEIDPFLLFLSFLFVVVFGFIFDNIIFYFEEMTKSTSYQYLVQSSYRIVMIMGFTIWVFAVFEATGLHIKESWVLAYTFSDQCAFLMSIFFCSEGVSIMVLSYYHYQQWIRADQIPRVALIEEFTSMTPFEVFHFNHLPFSSLRSQINTRIYRLIFTYLYRIGSGAQSFSYSEYLKIILDNTLYSMIGMDLYIWAFLLVIFGTTSLVKQYVDYPCNDEACRDRYRLILFTCGGILMLLLTILVVYLFNREEVKVIKHFGVETYQDYQVFLLMEDALVSRLQDSLPENYSVLHTIAEIKHNIAAQKIKCFEIPATPIGQSSVKMKKYITAARFTTKKVSPNVTTDSTQTTTTHFNEQNNDGSDNEIENSFEEVAKEIPPVEQSERANPKLLQHRESSFLRHIIAHKHSFSRSSSIGFVKNFRDRRPSATKPLDFTPHDESEKSDISDSIAMRLKRSHLKTRLTTDNPLHSQINITGLHFLISVVMTGNALYLAYWVTTFIFMITQYRSPGSLCLWFLISSIPVILSVALLTGAITSSSILISLAKIDIDNVATVIKQQKAVEKNMDLMRKAIKHKLVKHYGINNEKTALRLLFHEIDESNDGIVDIKEFYNMLVAIQMFLEMSVVKKMFSYIDLRQSGEITLEEFETFIFPQKQLLFHREHDEEKMNHDIMQIGGMESAKRLSKAFAEGNDESFMTAETNRII